uniref:Dockerin domain-containing protein n=1 Tax=candidate division CPR3 bacterium TaxID=2268181 RepID=A0A7V3JAI6_UNCC3
MNTKEEQQNLVLKKYLIPIFLLAGTIFAFCPSKALAIPAIYDNPGQGIFQCHANDMLLVADFLKGGGVIIRWDLLQPQDNDHLDQNELGKILGLIRNHRKSYLHFMIYYPNAVGNVFPSWLNATMVNNTVVPWDTTYQQKLAKFLSLLNRAFEEAGVIDSIEYIEPAAGGMWGTTHLWISQNELNNWTRAAGCGDVCDDTHKEACTCLGQKFTAGVNAVFDIYLNAFPKLPMMMIGGSCRYQECNYSGFNYLMTTYGMRVMKKEAGLGSPHDGMCGLRNYLGQVCSSDNQNVTKCGQETYGDSVPCGGVGFDPEKGCSYKKIYEESLRKERISYFCMYAKDINCSGTDRVSGEKITDINRWVAEKVGSQIFLLNYSLDGYQKRVGEPLTLNFTWQNNGSAPLIAPLKQGKKWLPSSYKLFVEFVKDNQVKFYQEFELNPATKNWLPYPLSTPVSTSIAFNIPSSLGGENENSTQNYKIYIGLTDPNGERKRFALRNTDAKNDLENRRYLLTDSFVVVGKGLICPSGEKGNLNCSADEKINEDDLNILLSSWAPQGPALPPPQGQSSADLNNDNKIDEKDLTVLLKNWKE